MRIRKPAESGSFEEVDTGTYLAICYQLVDLGTREEEFEGEKKRRRTLLVGFEFPHELMDDGRPYIHSEFYTFSFHERAKLRQHLESWRGKPFEDSDFDEEDGFRMERLLGKQCMLTLMRGKNAKRNKASSITPIPKGTGNPAEQCETRNDQVCVSLEPDEFREDDFAKLSEGLRKRIATSDEFHAVAEAAGIPF